MLIRKTIIGVVISFIVIMNMSQSYAIQCPQNAEPWDGDTKCRCVTGYIENQGRCVEFNLGTANVRALEVRNMVENASNCRAMARILKEFSSAIGYNESEELANYAGKIFSQDGVVFKIHRTSVYPLVLPEFSKYVKFGDSGFRSQYKQKGGNQVRHFVGYFVLGISSSNGMLSEPIYTAILAELREEVQADIDLGNVAAALGRQAAQSPHMMENIGVSIRSQVCE